jgi:hypothetical protein
MKCNDCGDKRDGVGSDDDITIDADTNVMPRSHINSRAAVMQRKTRRPVQFGIAVVRFRPGADLPRSAPLNPIPFIPASNTPNAESAATRSLPVP